MTAGGTAHIQASCSWPLCSAGYTDAHCCYSVHLAAEQEHKGCCIGRGQSAFDIEKAQHAAKEATNDNQQHEYIRKACNKLGRTAAVIEAAALGILPEAGTMAVPHLRISDSELQHS